MAQTSQKSEEKDFIKQMCGCYKVDFEYAETFSGVEDYEYQDRYSAHGLEWIFADEEEADKIVIQHLLVINDTTIIKHWRQDWLYENTDLLTYQQKLEWKRETLSRDKATGTWTQKVYQVDDSPRYQGNAHWVHVDGKTYWESQTYAPLPRREYTKRSDYNVMLRTNKHKMTNTGHVHELDNAKVIRSSEGEEVLVWEKGMNTYTKVDDNKCDPAKNWWKNNQAYWRHVRIVWDEVLSDQDYVNISKKVDGKTLWKELFALGDTYAGQEDIKEKKVQKKIKKIIKDFLTDQQTEFASNTKTSAKY